MRRQPDRSRHPRSPNQDPAWKIYTDRGRNGSGGRPAHARRHDSILGQGGARVRLQSLTQNRPYLASSAGPLPSRSSYTCTEALIRACLSYLRSGAAVADPARRCLRAAHEPAGAGRWPI